LTVVFNFVLVIHQKFAKAKIVIDSDMKNSFYGTEPSFARSVQKTMAFMKQIISRFVLSIFVPPGSGGIATSSTSSFRFLCAYADERKRNRDVFT